MEGKRKGREERRKEVGEGGRGRKEGRGERTEEEGEQGIRGLIPSRLAMHCLYSHCLFFLPSLSPIATSEISFLLAVPPSLLTNFLFDILIYCISLGPLSL